MPQTVAHNTDAARKNSSICTDVQQILLEMDRNDAVGAAERVLAGYAGPTLVK